MKEIYEKKKERKNLLFKTSECSQFWKERSLDKSLR